MYACGFFANAGNYKGMGDTKFIPNLDVDKFEAIVTGSQAYQSATKELAFLWSNCKKSIYNLTHRTKNFGFADDGITTYFSENCTQKDSDLVNDWLKLKKLDAYICRTFKITRDGRTTYEIKCASSETGDKAGITIPPEEHNGNTFVVTRGDYSQLLALVSENLAIAKDHAANANQVKMIEEYITSFQEGDLDAHKEGSR